MSAGRAVEVLACALLFSAPCLASGISLNPFIFECTIGAGGSSCPSATLRPTASGGLSEVVIGSAHASLNIPVWAFYDYKQEAEDGKNYVSDVAFTLHGDPYGSAVVTATIDLYAAFTLHANPYAYGYVYLQVWGAICNYYGCEWTLEYEPPPFEAEHYWKQYPQPSPWDSTIIRTFSLPPVTLDLGRLEVNNNPPGYERYGDYAVVSMFVSFDMIASTDKAGYQQFGDPSAAGVAQAAMSLAVKPDAPTDVPEPANILPTLGVVVGGLLAGCSRRMRTRRKCGLGSPVA